jgi:hypothetical protein
MMHHPYMAQQLMAERQRDMLDRASRDRLAREAQAAQAARAARPAAPGRTRPHRLRRVYAALTSH